MFKGVLPGLAVCITAILALNEIYWQFSSLWPIESWIATAILNSIFSFALLVGAYRYKIVSNVPWKSRPRPVYFLPAIGIVVGATALVLFTTQESYNPFGPYPLNLLSFGTVVWIPVCEELVFRVFWTSVFTRMSNRFWGGYFSVLLFAMVHTNFRVETLLSGELPGVPLGPFFLGLICVVLMYFSRSILPAIAFHAACNSTVFIFLSNDERWLRWLNFLYQ